MNWKIAYTRWGWSLFYQGELVASSEDPFALMALTLKIKEVVPS